MTTVGCLALQPKKMGINGHLVTEGEATKILVGGCYELGVDSAYKDIIAVMCGRKVPWATMCYDGVDVPYHLGFPLPDGAYTSEILSMHEND